MKLLAEHHIKDGHCRRRFDAGDCAHRDARVVPASDFEAGLFERIEIDAPLRQTYRRGRLERRSEYYRHSARESADDAAVVVRDRFYLVVNEAVGGLGRVQLSLGERQGVSDCG